MKVIQSELPDLLLFEPKKFADSRGFFYETFQAERYREYGLTVDFVQDNFSFSNASVLRGLHYQLQHAQGKLVWVTLGRVFDVAVDVRLGSPTFGKHISIILDADYPQQIYIPPGFAHGFYVLSDVAHFHYKCTDYYYPASELGIIWNDPDLSIDWPLQSAKLLLSEKDQVYKRLRDIPSEQLPKYI